MPLSSSKCHARSGVPAAACRGLRALRTLSRLASVEGQLSRSSDGKYLILAGYAAAPGSKDISSSSSATYNRVVGRIDAAGTINTATARSTVTSQRLATAANNTTYRGIAQAPTP